MRSSRPAYASLVDVPVLAPAIMAVAGALVILEATLLAGDLAVLPLALLVLGPPTVGTTLAARGITRHDGAFAVGVPFLIAIAEWLLGLAIDGTSASLVVGVSWSVTAALSLPMFLLIALHSGKRPPLDAGDALLGGAGVWLLCLHLVAYAVLPQAAPLLLAGAFGSAVLVAIALARGAQRRAFCLAAARGEIGDHRVRREVHERELDVLATVYGDPAEATAVLERLVRGPVESSGSAYRDRWASVPIGRVAAKAS